MFRWTLRYYGGWRKKKRGVTSTVLVPLVRAHKSRVEQRAIISSHTHADCKDMGWGSHEYILRWILTFNAFITLSGCLAYFCPCYVFGKTAEAVGDDCCLCGCAYLCHPFSFIARLHVRERIRQKKDLTVASCNPLCSFIMCLESGVLCQCRHTGTSLVSRPSYFRSAGCITSPEQYNQRCGNRRVWTRDCRHTYIN